MLQAEKIYYINKLSEHLCRITDFPTVKQSICYVLQKYIASGKILKLNRQFIINVILQYIQSNSQDGLDDTMPLPMIINEVMEKNIQHFGGDYIVRYKEIREIVQCQDIKLDMLKNDMIEYIRKKNPDNIVKTYFYLKQINFSTANQYVQQIESLLYLPKIKTEFEKESLERALAYLSKYYFFSCSSLEALEELYDYKLNDYINELLPTVSSLKDIQDNLLINNTMWRRVCSKYKINNRKLRNTEQFKLLKISEFESKRYNEGKVYNKEEKVKTSIHRKIERNSKLKSDCKKYFLYKEGRYYCMACGDNFEYKHADKAHEEIEFHHNVPVKFLKDGEGTLIKDMRMVCMSCHKRIHRYKMTFEEYKKIVEANKEEYRLKYPLLNMGY